MTKIFHRQCFFIIASLLANKALGITGIFQPEVQSLLETLAQNPHQPSLWRRLGKLQLDAGEFAEARRIFCHGSSCCPEDESLLHHQKVYSAFHEPEPSATKTSPSAPPPLSSVPNNSDLFLSFQVPPTEIPESIRKHPSGSVLPEFRNRLIHASTAPILDKASCNYLIQAALDTTKHRGWTKDRHLQAPTCDVPVFDLETSAQQWILQSFRNVLFPLLCRLVAPELEINPNRLRVQDCFIVRYDANDEEPGFASLKPHQDESLLSLTIALNDMEDYEDGGLFIACTQDLLNGPAGTVLCFAGELLHGGYPVTKGTRWILTVFLYVDENQSGIAPGYTLEALEKLKCASKQ